MSVNTFNNKNSERINRKVSCTRAQSRQQVDKSQERNVSCCRTQSRQQDKSVDRKRSINR